MRAGHARRIASAVGIALLWWGLPGEANAAIRAERILTNLNFPIFVTAAPGDTRLFVVERAGRVLIVEDGQSEPETTAFLNIQDRVRSNFGEGGLLSIAFPPNFAFAPGDYVYAYYSADGSGLNELDLRVSRFSLLDQMETVRADESSEEILFSIEKIEGNHNGGTIAFRGDWLYLGLGDGGGGGDPEENAQDDNSLFGKMLRWDTAAGPPWNPEVWAKGLRNPFRFSFDRQTQDLYIADVGQGALEEIDVQPAAANAGENYGWDVHEGTNCFDPDPGIGELPCDDPAFTFPVYEYAQLGGDCGSGGSGSVTGGYVYRGSAVPEIQGHYFFADFCTDAISSLVWDGAGGTSGPVMDRSAELVPDNGSIENIVSFGEDASGELYIVDMFDGEVFRVPEAGAGAGFFAVMLALLGWWHRAR